MVAARTIAPIKSTRWILFKKLDSSSSESIFVVLVGNFHMIRRRPNRVRGHCPKKELYLSANKYLSALTTSPSPSNCVCEPATYGTSK